MKTTAQPLPPDEQPPRFRRFDEAYNWLADRGWRQVGASRGSHFRMEHPAYSKPLFLIYKRAATWGPYQQVQLTKRLDLLERRYRRDVET